MENKTKAKLKEGLPYFEPVTATILVQYTYYHYANNLISC